MAVGGGNGNDYGGARNQLRESGMGVISLLWGVLALLWMILALIPLLGWGNWFLIPFAASVRSSPRWVSCSPTRASVAGRGPGWS